MAHRTILTECQRAPLFDLPSNEAAPLRHYTLADDDILHIQPGQPQQNAYIERYNRTVRHEWLANTSLKASRRPNTTPPNGQEPPRLFRVSLTSLIPLRLPQLLIFTQN